MTYVIAPTDAIEALEHMAGVALRRAGLIRADKPAITLTHMRGCLYLARSSAGTVFVWVSIEEFSTTIEFFAADPGDLGRWNRRNTALHYERAMAILGHPLS